MPVPPAPARFYRVGEKKRSCYICFAKTTREDSCGSGRYIQELLGHKSSKTTKIYTHVLQKSLQKIRSPFDDL